jgi:hypothetical protein
MMATVPLYFMRQARLSDLHRQHHNTVAVGMTDNTLDTNHIVDADVVWRMRNGLLHFADVLADPRA